VTFQFVEIGDLAYGLLQFVFQLRHVVLGDSEALPGPFHGAADFLGRAGGIAEIAADRLLDVLAAEQPQDYKQRHHGGHKIRVGDFPGSAVVASMAAFFLDDDDGRFRRHEPILAISYAADASGCAAASPLSLMCASASWNVGRRWLGMALLPISITTVGAVPFSIATSITRSTW
jgi:hypothetical protein